MASFTNNSNTKSKAMAVASLVSVKSDKAICRINITDTFAKNVCGDIPNNISAEQLEAVLTKVLSEGNFYLKVVDTTKELETVDASEY